MGAGIIIYLRPCLIAMIFIDKLCYTSKIRYVNPIEKFTYALGTIVLAIMSRSILVGGILLIANGFFVVRLGGFSYRRYIQLLKLPLFFLILSTLAILINLAREPLDAFAIAVGKFYLTGSYKGIIDMLKLVMTAMGAISSMFFLSINTPISDLIWVFRKLKIPDALCQLMLLIYRFIFVLLNSAQYIRHAQEARLGYNGYKRSIKSFSSLIAMLFVDAIRKSSELFDAMQARCYDGSINVLTEHNSVNPKRLAIIIGIEIILILSVMTLRIMGKGLF